MFYVTMLLYRIGSGGKLELKVNEAYGPVSTQLSPSDNAEGVNDI